MLVALLRLMPPARAWLWGISACAAQLMDTCQGRGFGGLIAASGRSEIAACLAAGCVIRCQLWPKWAHTGAMIPRLEGAASLCSLAGIEGVRYGLLLGHVSRLFHAVCPATEVAIAESSSARCPRLADDWRVCAE